MKKLVLNRVRMGFALVCALLVMNSCIFNDEIDHKINRTVLVYIGADNNLSNTANSNIYAMNTSVSSGMDNYNLLVFLDRKDFAPALLHVHNLRIDTIAKYPELDTSDPMVLRKVIDDVLKDWKAEHYGLVMWSHGTGWIPTDKLHFVAPNMNYAPLRGNKVKTLLEGRRDPFGPETKAFSWEDRKGQSPSYTCMELGDMADAIPDNVFDFILFDACYMGNVEVMYALRNKAQYIISSCYEVVSYGFPYHIVTRDLLNGSVLKVCNEFYQYYNSMSGWEQMAGVSLVNTAELDSLARCFRKVAAEYGANVDSIDVSKVQCFDRFNNHVFFDLEDVVEKLGTDRELMNEFRLQLAKCVSFKISTPYIFPGDAEQIKVNSYSGLSIYLPLSRYEASGLNDAYRQTEWSDYTGY